MNTTVRNLKKAIYVLFPFSLITFMLLLLYMSREFGIRLKLPIVLLTLIIIIYMIYILIIIIYNGGIRAFILKNKIFDSLDESFVSIGAYTDNKNYLITPNTTINIKNKLIRIKIDNLNIRKKIENSREIISGALPKNIISQKVYLTKDEKYLVIEYIDLTDQKRKIYESFNSFYNDINSLSYLSLKVDDNSIIDLSQNPMILCAASTGGGKSYFARYLLYQCLLKKYKCIIIDPKSTYQIFEDICPVAYMENGNDYSSIKNALDSVLKELHHRQDVLASVFKNNPDSLASDFKEFPPYFVLFEEYLAFSSRLTKKENEEITQKLLEIITTGRQLSIHLCIITQTSGTDTLDTRIRANCSVRISLGNNSPTVYEMLFQEKGMKLPTKKERGEGLIQMDNELSNVIIPTLSFDLKDIFNYLHQCRGDPKV